MLAASAAANASGAQDAVTAAERAINEYMLRTQVIISCHQVQTDADVVYIDSGMALGDATFEQLWAHFDAADPTQHVQNGHKADDTMQHLIVEAERKAQQLVQEKGCAALEDELKALQ
jgi:hypothetical protein